LSIIRPQLETAVAIKYSLDRTMSVTLTWSEASFVTVTRHVTNLRKPRESIQHVASSQVDTSVRLSAEGGTVAVTAWPLQVYLKNGRCSVRLAVTDAPYSGWVRVGWIRFGYVKLRLYRVSTATGAEEDI
jgi:hypothetical protein